MSDHLASIRALFSRPHFQGSPLKRGKRDRSVVIVDAKWYAELSAVLASVPRMELDNHHNALTCPHCNPKGLKFPEESLATRILQEQKDLEAHTRAVTDVDRLVQIRDSLLKEPQP